MGNPTHEVSGCQLRIAPRAQQPGHDDDDQRERKLPRPLRARCHDLALRTEGHERARLLVGGVSSMLAASHQIGMRERAPILALPRTIS